MDEAKEENLIMFEERDENKNSPTAEIWKLTEENRPHQIEYVERTTLLLI